MSASDSSRQTRPGGILVGGLLNGLLTGLGWSTVVEVFSSDMVFDGSELLLSLVVPAVVAVVAVLVWRLWKTGFWFGVTVSYLTVAIPLLGLGIGGANIVLMTVGGAIGGAFWSGPFVAWRWLRTRRGR